MGNGLKLLQVGQTIQLQPLEFACNLAVLPSGEPGLKVVEVGIDYVVLEDAGEGVRTQIPMHLIKAVTGVEPVEPVVAATPAPVPAAA
jgi:hypothetical protein